MIQKNNKPLTFKHFTKTNKTRCEKYFKHKLDDWNPAEWSNAIAGECGEACNLTKKLLRGDNIDIKEIGKELADIICYTDLLATKLGFDLETILIEKFNEVSDRRNVSIKL